LLQGGNNMKKFFKLFVIFILCLSIGFVSMPAQSVHAGELSGTVTQHDLAMLAEGINLANATTGSVRKSFNGDSSDIFDISNPDFVKLFTAQSDSEDKSFSIVADSRDEFCEKYSEKHDLGLKANVDLPYGANIDGTFDTSRSAENQVQNVRYEHFEYYEMYKHDKKINAKWTYSQYDLGDYFDSQFVVELSQINDLLSAIEFMEKYGTHVFNSYTLGGVAVATTYTIGNKNIQEVYTDNKKELNLETSIGNVGSAQASNNNYLVSNEFLNNEDVCTQDEFVTIGGVSEANSISDFFRYQFGGVGTSKPNYTSWKNSIGDSQYDDKLKVIAAKNPVALWDLIANSRYVNADLQSLLAQAFDIMCMEGAVDLSNANGVNSGVIKSVSYSKDGRSVSIDITSDSLKVPAGSEVIFNYGELFDKLFDADSSYSSADVSLSLAKNYSGVSISGNTVNIGSDVSGMLEIKVLLKEQQVAKFYITIESEHYGYYSGYGTKDQPYLISNTEEWNNFVDDDNATEENITYYKLADDIDFKGKIVGPAFSNGFTGVLDGDGHALSNLTVVAEAENTNVGIFAKNQGIIKNLVIDDVRVLNNGYINVDGEVNGGILVGFNDTGIVQNVLVKDSAIRLTTQIDDRQNFNVGAVVGKNNNEVKEAGVDACLVFAQTFDGEAIANVGGLAGMIDTGKVEDSYVKDSSVTVVNYDDKQPRAEYNAGLFAGNVVSKKATKDSEGKDIPAVVAKVTGCISYDNKIVLDGAHNYTHKDYGEVCVKGNFAGQSTFADSFKTCYFTSANVVAGETTNSIGDKVAVGRLEETKTVSGCKQLAQMSLKQINNSAFSSKWTSDDGDVVLKVHKDLFND